MNNSKLKFKPRKKIYESANCTFDPETKIAKSYHWWVFVAEIKGLIVFNDYKYSPTTARHQHLIKCLLSELGIKIDLIINTREGLQSLQNIKTKKKLLKEAQNNRMSEEKREKEKREAKRVARNLRAKELRQLSKIHL